MFVVILSLILSLTGSTYEDAEIMWDDMVYYEEISEHTFRDSASFYILETDTVQWVWEEHYSEFFSGAFLSVDTTTITTWNYMLKADTLFLESTVIMYNGVEVLLIPLSHPEFP